jgi:hypothetical protein
VRYSVILCFWDIITEYNKAKADASVGSEYYADSQQVEEIQEETEIREDSVQNDTKLSTSVDEFVGN